MSKELLSRITTGIVKGESEETVDLTRKALSAGLAPLDIIEMGLIPGMDRVGEKFSRGEYFLPNLIISANSMQEAMQVLAPELRARQQEIRSAGKVVMGTVAGDIHEIGKSLVATMLSVAGFQVYDLGVDVPLDAFIEKVKETGADLVGLSALLTTTMIGQREVIEALHAAGLRESVKVIVGGAPVTRSWAEEIGADGYAEDAIGAVELANRLVNRPVPGSTV